MNEEGHLAGRYGVNEEGSLAGRHGVNEEGSLAGQHGVNEEGSLAGRHGVNEEGSQDEYILAAPSLLQVYPNCIILFHPRHLQLWESTCIKCVSLKLKSA